MKGQHKGPSVGPRDYTGSGEAGDYPRYGAGSRDMNTLQAAGGLREEPRQLRARARMPRSYQRSDQRIREEICERLADNDRLDATDVSVEVSSGRVVLEGSVPERRMKYMIEDTAAECLGTNEVENRIRIAQPQAGAQ
ncbi:MAG TPA: BON domain-containing protein [Burkholderiales bacterium]